MYHFKKDLLLIIQNHLYLNPLFYRLEYFQALNINELYYLCEGSLKPL